ncbi:MAG: DUF488 family protein [Azospirillaceae bacterium]
MTGRSHGTIRVRRAHDAAAETERPAGETRVLVDRIWPRGLSKAALGADHWIREAAPSTGLRKWFAHDADKWAEFRRRYAAELDARPETVARLLDLARAGDLTLLFAARERDHNNAVALKAYLEDRLADEAADG